jgi:hypothetical protein
MVYRIKKNETTQLEMAATNKIVELTPFTKVRNVVVKAAIKNESAKAISLGLNDIEPFS